MNIVETPLGGLFEIENKVFKDDRGSFIKTFHSEVFAEKGLDAGFKESFYSISNKGVLRGMHYQLPPHDHSKLVYVISGRILDVVVDVRENSETFGKYYSTELSEDNAKSLYIAKGFAHGFLTLSEKATVVYMTSTVHSPNYDTGIRWDSFGFDWNEYINFNENSFVISERDRAFNKLLDNN